MRKQQVSKTKQVVYNGKKYEVCLSYAGHEDRAEIFVNESRMGIVLNKNLTINLPGHIIEAIKKYETSSANIVDTAFNKWDGKCGGKKSVFPSIPKYIKFMVSAVFLGRDGSCGYVHGATYRLTVWQYKSHEVLLEIKRLDGGGACDYTSMKTFLKNWEKVCIIE